MHDEKKPLIGRSLQKAIQDGSRFSLQRDPEDDQWDIVSFRVPNARIKHGPDAKVTTESKLEGHVAQLTQHEYVVANAESIVRQAMLNGGAPQELVAGVSHIMMQVIQEIRVMRAQGDEEPKQAPVDINAALERAKQEAASGEAPQPGKIILLR